MSKRSFVIGIAGGSGSGKTSFLRALREQLNSDEVCYISLDDYYLPREEQHVDNKGVQNFDLPTSIKSEELEADLDKILNGETVIKEKYTFNNKLATKSSIELKPAKVVIVEGLYIYDYEGLRQKFDLKLFIDAQHELKLIRRIKRDREERNYPLEDVVYRYENHVMPSYRKHIEIYKQDVDIIINNNKSFERGLELIKTYILSMI